MIEFVLSYVMLFLMLTMATSSPATAAETDYNKPITNNMNPTTTRYTKMNEQLLAEVERKVAHYESRMNGFATDMMMNEARIQYVHMAQGGDGTAAECGEIRKTYYKGFPDEFFQAVCNRLGWRY